MQCEDFPHDYPQYRSIVAIQERLKAFIVNNAYELLITFRFMSIAPENVCLCGTRVILPCDSCFFEGIVGLCKDMARIYI